jgi:hypothetical protein
VEDYVFEADHHCKGLAGEAPVPMSAVQIAASAPERRISLVFTRLIVSPPPLALLLKHIELLLKREAPAPALAGRFMVTSQHQQLCRH